MPLLSFARQKLTTDDARMNTDKAKQVDLLFENPSVLIDAPSAVNLHSSNDSLSFNPESGGERSILFVCTGNLCRSPMAEYLLRHHLGRDSSWKVGSAGTYAIEGAPASRQAVAVLRDMGIDLTPHRSRELRRDLVESSRMVVAMTTAHADEIKRRFPDASAKVVLLKSFDKGSRSGDIHDPIGESKEVYGNICREIDEALLDLILYLRSQRQ